MKLTDVVDRINGNVDRFTTELEYYIGGEHFESNELEVTQKGLLKENLGKLGFKFHFAFQDRDVVFMARNPHLRKAGMVRFAGLCSDASYILRSKDETVLSQEYLAVMLQSDHFWDYCESHKVGSVNFANNWSSIANYEFELPTPEEQKEISDQVWAAYRLKQSYKKLLAATEEMVKSQFIEMFNDSPLVRLEDHIETQSGGTPNTKKSEYYDGGTIPWLSSGEVNQGYISSTEKYITEEGFENSAAKWVPKNSVVIAMYGATAGKVGFITIPLTTNQAVCALLPNDAFNPLYLYYAVSSQKNWMIAQCRGAAQPNISQGIIRSMEIPMPSLSEQMQFVNIIKQADKSGFDGRKSQFIEMFGNPLSSIQRYSLKKLGDCCELNPRRPNLSLKDTDKVSFVPMPSVSENGCLQDVTDEEYGKVKKGFTYFENGDVLFAKITPCMENGKGAIAEGLTNNIGMGSTEFHVLRPIEELSSPYWLLALTRLQIFRERARKNMTGTGGQKRVPANYLENFMVGLPPIEEQSRFENIYKQADKSGSVGLKSGLNFAKLLIHR